MNRFGTPCIVCHDKNAGYQYYNKISRIYDLLVANDIEPVPGPLHYGFDMDANFHCRYGLHCPQMEQEKSRIRMTALQLDPIMYALSQSDNKSLQQEVLQLLRGDYPCVYRQFERDIHSHN